MSRVEPREIRARVSTFRAIHVKTVIVEDKKVSWCVSDLFLR